MSLRERLRHLLRPPAPPPPAAPRRAAPAATPAPLGPGYAPLPPLPTLTVAPAGVPVIRIDTWGEGEPPPGPIVVTGDDPLHVACTAELWLARGVKILGILPPESQ